MKSNLTSPNDTLSDTELDGMLQNYEAQLDVKYRGYQSKFIACKLLLRIWLKYTERNFMNGPGHTLRSLTLTLLEGK